MYELLSGWNWLCCEGKEVSASFKSPVQAPTQMPQEHSSEIHTRATDQSRVLAMSISQIPARSSRVLPVQSRASRIRQSPPRESRPMTSAQAWMFPALVTSQLMRTLWVTALLLRTR